MTSPPVPRLRHLTVVVFVWLLRGAIAHAQRPASSPLEIERWIAANAIPLRSVELAGNVVDLRPFASVVGSARVVAFGENTHGAHEPLSFRNRLFRYLVEELGFTAIAVETGLPESRSIADFVRGGAGAASLADAPRITRDHFTWGFGNFAENAELVRWMRASNDDPAHPRKLSFYGIDLSLGGRQGSTPTPAAIESALRFVARVDPPVATRLQTRFTPLMRHLPGDPSASITAPERDSLSAAINALVDALERRMAAYVAASSPRDHAWALRNAVVARQGDRLHRVQAPAVRGGGIPPGAWRELSARDSAMADNVRWALEREGAAGRVLVFAHDVHVKNASTVGGPWRLERPPAAMGQFLRAALGDRLVVIGSAGGAASISSTSPRASIDATLARAQIPRFALDLRRARAEPAMRAWLGTDQGLRVNRDPVIMLKPGTAFDVLLYVDSLSPARSNAP